MVHSKVGSGCAVGGIGYVLIWILCILGWVQCIYKFATSDFSSKTTWKREVIYGIGTFTGAVGCVVGWIDIEDVPVKE